MSSDFSPRSLSLLPPSLSHARRPSLLRPLPYSAPSPPPCTGEHPRRLLEFAAAHGLVAEGQGRGAAYPRRRSGGPPLLPPRTADDLFAHGRILPPPWWSARAAPRARGPSPLLFHQRARGSESGHAPPPLLPPPWSPISALVAATRASLRVTFFFAIFRWIFR